MKCPFCGNIEDKVIDSRQSKDGIEIRRRRECLECGRRFTTYEKIEETTPLVVKKNNQREAFNSNKIRKSLLISCQKRPISSEQIENIIKKIENYILSKEHKETPSSKIGFIVMEELKKLDKVAYIRFASVYKDFKDPEDFVEEIQEIK